MKEYSREIADAVKNFLEKDEWKFSFNEKEGYFRMGLTLSGKLKSIDYIIRIYNDDFCVHAISSIGADMEDEAAVHELAKFFCETNYIMHYGNYAMDLDDGQIIYKACVDCDGDVMPTEEMVKNSIYIPASMYKRHANAIVGIIFAGMSAKDALELVKKADR